MKFAIVIPDGAADLPVPALGNRTPLAAARMPYINSIAAMGRCGTVRTVPAGMSPGSDMAILSVLGYDPRQHYTGRAPLEAAAQGLEVGPADWIFRCNLVTVVDGIMEDHSAGHIQTTEAATLIADINRLLGGPHVQFHPGISYRHLMVFKADCDVITTPPHDILGKPIAAHLPTGQAAELLRTLIGRSRTILENHEINAVRRDLGENPANCIWLWGQGKMPHLPSFIERFGVRGAAITAVDLLRGIAKLIGWKSIDVPGATGYLDTNFAGKGAAAVAALDDCDLVVVHVEATDEAGHNADPEGKVAGLEQIDRHIVGPLLERLQREGDDWRIMIVPDHPTPVSLRTHTAEPSPFAMAGKGVPNIQQEPFNEATAKAGDLHISPGHELMEFFLTVR